MLANMLLHLVLENEARVKEQSELSSKSGLQTVVAFH